MVGGRSPLVGETALAPPSPARSGLVGLLASSAHASPNRRWPNAVNEDGGPACVGGVILDAVVVDRSVALAGSAAGETSRGRLASRMHPPTRYTVLPLLAQLSDAAVCRLLSFSLDSKLDAHCWSGATAYARLTPQQRDFDILRRKKSSSSGPRLLFRGVYSLGDMRLVLGATAPPLLCIQRASISYRITGRLRHHSDQFGQYQSPALFTNLSMTVPFGWACMYKLVRHSGPNRIFAKLS